MRVLRERVWVIVACVIVCVGAAVIYVSTAAQVYEAEADILVTPVTTDTEALVGLPLVRESNDPTRDVETVSRLVTSGAVADRVKSDLNSPRTPRGLLNHVAAARSRRATSSPSRPTRIPPRARRRSPTLRERDRQPRTDDLHKQLDEVIPRLRGRRRAAGSPDSPARNASSCRSTSCRRCAAAMTRP